MKPIIFNTEMVRAILDGRKTVTRRAVNYKHLRGLENLTAEKIYCACKAPVMPGDILYVRETWTTLVGSYLYKADQKPNMKSPGKWRPSIHMPKEAARIFLRVTGVRVERLHDINEAGASHEGFYKGWRLQRKGSCALSARQAFMWLWDFIAFSASTCPSWAANPWVWVIEFERCEKPEDEP